MWIYAVSTMRIFIRFHTKKAMDSVVSMGARFAMRSFIIFLKRFDFKSELRFSQHCRLRDSKMMGLKSGIYSIGILQYMQPGKTLHWPIFIKSHLDRLTYR